jgi:hypothetical protein
VSVNAQKKSSHWLLFFCAVVYRLHNTMHELLELLVEQYNQQGDGNQDKSDLGKDVDVPMQAV